MRRLFMTKKKHETPLLDELQGGKWPSFVDGLKRLANDDDKQYSPMMNDLMGQLEHSYDTKLGYWKGGTVSVFGYGGGVIPRFSQVAEEYPESKEFHTLRVMPPAGMHYTTDFLRKIGLEDHLSITRKNGLSSMISAFFSSPCTS